MVGGVASSGRSVAEEHQLISADAEQHAEADSERGRDQHVDMDAFVALATSSTAIAAIASEKSAASA